MRRSLVALALVVSAARVEAACQEGKHCFLHAKYTSNSCWDVRKSTPGTSLLVSQTASPAGPDGSPGASIVMDGLGLLPDPQVLASQKYVLVYGSSWYTFYERATGKPLVATECVPLSGQFTDLFAPLLLAKDKTGAANPSNINLEAPQSPKTCNIDTIDACPGSCINEAYDARAFFDRDSSGAGRWWILVQARNQMWTDDTGGACPSNGVQKDESRRYLLVAVSKSENPNDGFHEYVLARDYADWPLFSVNNGRLLLAHRASSKNVFVFDADQLAAGTNSDPFLGQYGAISFADSDKIVPVTQYSGGGGASYLLGQSGNDLHVYAFIDPTKTPAHRKVTPSRVPNWYMQPVLRHGKFYFAFDAEADPVSGRRAVDVFRVPVSLTGTSPLTIDVDKGDATRLFRNDSSLERPGVEVETSDTVIVWYMRYGLAGDDPAPQVRYNVHYPSDAAFDFRDAATLHTGGGKPSGSLHDFADIDLPGGNSDPDAVAFWISHAYSDASGAKRQVVGQVKPGCGEQTQCGTECVTFASDPDNCGSCGHACPGDQECRNGVCKQPPFCDPCQCDDGFKPANVCEPSAACTHICRAHERD